MLPTTYNWPIYTYRVVAYCSQFPTDEAVINVLSTLDKADETGNIRKGSVERLKTGLEANEDIACTIDMIQILSHICQVNIDVFLHDPRTWLISPLQHISFVHPHSFSATQAKSKLPTISIANVPPLRVREENGEWVEKGNVSDALLFSFALPWKCTNACAVRGVCCLLFCQNCSITIIFLLMFLLLLILVY